MNEHDNKEDIAEATISVILIVKVFGIQSSKFFN